MAPKPSTMKTQQNKLCYYSKTRKAPLRELVIWKTKRLRRRSGGSERQDNYNNTILFSSLLFFWRNVMLQATAEERPEAAKQRSNKSLDLVWTASEASLVLLICSLLLRGSPELGAPDRNGGIRNILAVDTYFSSASTSAQRAALLITLSFRHINLSNTHINDSQNPNACWRAASKLENLVWETTSSPRHLSWWCMHRAQQLFGQDHCFWFGPIDSLSIKLPAQAYTECIPLTLIIGSSIGTCPSQHLCIHEDIS